MINIEKRLEKKKKRSQSSGTDLTH